MRLISNMLKLPIFYSKISYFFSKSNLKNFFRSGCRQVGNPGVGDVNIRVFAKPERGCWAVYLPCSVGFYALFLFLYREVISDRVFDAEGYSAQNMNLCSYSNIICTFVTLNIISMKTKKKDSFMDYIKANRKGSREAEIENHGHPVSFNRVHVSKKVYNRKRDKADARRHLPYWYFIVYCN